MQYRRLGNTEFLTSEIGFGGASISGEGRGYGMGPISFDESIELIHRAYDMGINLFDTAPIYGFGMSEQRIGAGVKKFRDKVFIVSKSGVGWHENGRVDMDNGPTKTLKMLEASLRRLDSDYIDLYMIHWPDKKWDIRYPLEVLAKAQLQGKIKHIGLCNTNTDDLLISQEICKVSVVQSEYNLFTQEKLNDVSEQIQAMDLGFMSWGTLDKGILSGTVKKGRVYEKEDARNSAPWWNKKEVEEKIIKVKKLNTQIGSYSLLEVALQHNLANPMLSSALCGARNSNQLESLVAAAQTKIPNPLLLKAQEILA